MKTAFPKWLAIGLLIVSCASKKEVTKAKHSEETKPLTTQSTTSTKITYTKDIKPIITQNCTYKCHTGKKNQKRVNLDTYQNVRKTFEIGRGYARVHNSQRPMPKKGKMPNATLAILDQWKQFGFLEK